LQATTLSKFDTVITMRGFVPPDPQTEVSVERYAVVYVPKRSRKRFPAGCVEIVESEQAAIDQSDATNKHFPAIVLGPSKSSEGQLIYYLVKWLMK
jgi:hypothetical protein